MERLARFSLTHPIATVIALIAASAVLGSGLLDIRAQTGYRTFLGDDHPELQRFDHFVERFGGGYPILVAYSCDDTEICDSVLEATPLEMAHELSLEFEGLPGVTAVHTPATARLMVPNVDGSGSDVRSLYEHGKPAPDIDQLIPFAANDPLWDRTIVAQKGKVGAIVVELQATGTDLQDKVTRQVYDALKPYQDKLGFEFRMVGKSVEFVIANVFVTSETNRVMPVLVVLLFGVLYYLFRSPIAAFLAIATMGIAALWSQGIMGLLDIPMDAVTTNSSAIVFVVGICDAVHLLARYAQEVSSQDVHDRTSRCEALLRVAQDIGGACFLTSATTIVAFFAFMFAGYQSFFGFAVTTGFGIASALVLSFTLLPLLIAYIGADWTRKTRDSRSWDEFAQWICDVTEQHTTAILVVTGALVVLCSYGVSQIYVEVDDEELQGRDNPVTVWSNWVEANYRAPKSLEIQLNLPEGTTLESVEAFSTVRAVESYLSTGVENLGPAHSPLAILDQTYRFLSGTDQPPDSVEAIGESLIFAPRDLLSTWLSNSWNRVRVSTESATLSSSESAVALAKVRSHLDSELPEGWTYDMTGVVVLASTVARDLFAAQMRTFAIAFALVFLCLAWGLRSIRMALFGMIPNLLPVILVAGALGLWNVPFDIAMTMVAAILLGIAVDDTIHLLFQYRHQVQQGTPSPLAVRRSMTHIGRSVITSSFALSLGFLGLGMSASMSTVSNFAMLTSLSIIVALVADLVLLPAMIHACSGWLVISQTTQEEADFQHDAPTTEP